MLKKRHHKKAKRSASSRAGASEAFYVAFDPATGSDDVVASGPDVGEVIASARKKGVEVPAVMFVPQEGVTYIY
ncbi:MAG: hypothetical protein JW715_13800 [Sedimentisphaerales bacterium]|nr:hypothetical protein [Sedimentisphaerales bacterium]